MHSVTLLESDTILVNPRGITGCDQSLIHSVDDRFVIIMYALMKYVSCASPMRQTSSVFSRASLYKTSCFALTTTLSRHCLTFRAFDIVEDLTEYLLKN